MGRELAEEKARTRSGLWGEYKRLISEIRPRWVLIENVANLRSEGLSSVLKDLWSLGYDAEWDIISARDIFAPHLRERIWIIAYPNGESVRNNEQWSETGRNGVQPERETFSGDNGEEGRDQTSDSDSEGLQGHVYEYGEDGEVGGTEISGCSDSGLRGSTQTYAPYANDFRFWPTFASEEEKSLWWAEASAGFSDWWEVTSEFCRVDDDVSGELDESESFRKARIKQLGNSIVPGIVKIIGERIKYHECNALSQL